MDGIDSLEVEIFYSRHFSGSETHWQRLNWAVPIGAPGPLIQHYANDPRDCMGVELKNYINSRDDNILIRNQVPNFDGGVDGLRDVYHYGIYGDLADVCEKGTVRPYIVFPAYNGKIHLRPLSLNEIPEQIRDLVL